MCKLLQVRAISTFTDHYPLEVHPKTVCVSNSAPSPPNPSIHILIGLWNGSFPFCTGNLPVFARSLVNQLHNQRYFLPIFRSPIDTTAFPFERELKAQPTHHHMFNVIMREDAEKKNLAWEGRAPVCRVTAVHGKLMNSLSRSQSLFFRLRRWLISVDPRGSRVLSVQNTGFYNGMNRLYFIFWKIYSQSKGHISER